MKIKFKDEIMHIDPIDMEIFKSHIWHIHTSTTNKYLRGYKKGNRKLGLKYFHRIITNDSGEVDHKNNNGLDNRRINLRIVDRTQNNANRRDKGTKGVHFESQTQKYRAIIHFKGKRYNLGRYHTLLEAKETYNKKAKELFGEYSNVMETKYANS